jgi:hypothetical protein
MAVPVDMVQGARDNARVRPCDVDDCANETARSGLCWGHLKQRQRGQATHELRARGQGPRRVFLSAVLDLMEVDSGDEEAWRRCWHRLRVAARRYVLAPKPQNRYRSAGRPHTPDHHPV